MKHKSKFLIITLLLIVSVLSFANTAQAQGFLEGIVPCGTSYASSPCTVCHFYILLHNIINFLLYTSASLATLMAVYIGFLFLLSGGSQKMITDAKSKLWLLVWGIGWVLGSWLVLNTIITFIADPKVFPMPWNQISCEVSRPSGGENTSTTSTTSQVTTAPISVSLNENTRRQLVAVLSVLLQSNPQFANEITRLAESSSALHNFFLEINGTRPVPLIILSREESAWMRGIAINGLSHSFLASLMSQFAQRFFHVIKAASLSISSVTPQGVAPGSTVVIRGTGFSPTDNTFNLTFPDGTVAIYNDIPSQENGTVIQGVVPQTIIGGKYTFYISNENGISNTAALNIDIIASAANFIVNHIDIREAGGDQGQLTAPVSPESLVDITDNEDGSTTVSSTIAGSTLSVTVSQNSLSISLTDPDGSTTSTNINDVTVSPNGNITGQISATVNGQEVDSGSVSINPSNNTVTINTQTESEAANTTTATSETTSTVTTTDAAGNTTTTSETTSTVTTTDAAGNTTTTSETTTTTTTTDAAGNTTTTSTPSEVDTSVPDAPTPDGTPDGSTPDGSTPDGTPGSSGDSSDAE